PHSLQEAGEVRLNHLSADARRIAQLAAVTGRLLDFALLKHVTRDDGAAVLQVREELMAAALVREGAAERPRLRHALGRHAPHGGRAGTPTRCGATVRRRAPTTDGRCTQRVKSRRDAASGRVFWTWAFCGRGAITHGPGRICSKRWT